MLVIELNEVQFGQIWSEITFVIFKSSEHVGLVQF